MNHCIIVCANNVGEMGVCLHQYMDLVCLTEDEYGEKLHVTAEIRWILLNCNHQMLGGCSDGGDLYPNSSVYVD